MQGSKLDKPSSLSLFNFLFCELIEECANNSKEGGQDRLKRVGEEIGFKIFTIVSLKRGITERAGTIMPLLRNIQQKVWKHLFGHQAARVEMYEPMMDNDHRIFSFGIIDDNSVYLTWIPEKLWYTAVLVAGIVQGILLHSGLKCSVVSHSHLENEKTQTHFQVAVEEKEYQRWKEAD